MPKGSRPDMPAPPAAMPVIPPADVSAGAPAALPVAASAVIPASVPPVVMPMSGMAETGQMPQNGLLAAAYVPVQRQDSPRYTKEEALKNGTMFPGLNLPYERYIPNKEVANTPQGELMALCFVLNELGLYLDTHPHDKEALRLRNGFVELYNQASKKMEMESGPITQNVVMENGYSWIDSPWPWEK